MKTWYASNLWDNVAGNKNTIFLSHVFKQIHQHTAYTTSVVTHTHTHVLYGGCAAPSDINWWIIWTQAVILQIARVKSDKK